MNKAPLQFHITFIHPLYTRSNAGVSNSNWSVGQMGTHKVIRGPHCDAEATIAVPECTRNSFYILFPAKHVMNYRQIISSRLSHSY